MTETITAIFDGQWFRPDKPIKLTPNTRVKLTVETEAPVEGKPRSFLQTARSLKLAGPPDWSENIDEYLYGGNIKNDTESIS